MAATAAVAEMPAGKRAGDLGEGREGRRKLELELAKEVAAAPAGPERRGRGPRGLNQLGEAPTPQTVAG